MTDTNPATPATPANPGIAPALVLDHVSVSSGTATPRSTPSTTFP
nr:hypothetical protein [Corynebacterium xerosis]